MIGILQNLVVSLSANADIKVVLIAILFGLMARNWPLCWAVPVFW